MFKDWRREFVSAVGDVNAVRRKLLTAYNNRRKGCFVEIKFSRHAKRRAKLYKIQEATILKVMEGKELKHGNREIIENVKGFKYPLKIVMTVKGKV